MKTTFSAQKAASISHILQPVSTQAINVLNDLAELVHAKNVLAGWWSYPATGGLKDRNVGEMLALVHSEISEALEGHRKDLADDTLPHRKMFDVELADAIIRIMDIAGARGIPLGTIIFEKMQYNSTREDHKPENRLKEGGKAF